MEIAAECNIADFNVYKFVMPVIASNMYIVLSEHKALVVDPHESHEALDLLQKNGIQDVLMILTHEHYDHISGVNFFREQFECVVYGSQVCKEYVTDPSKNMAAYFMAMFMDRSNEERLQVERLADETYCCEVDIGFEKSMDIEWEGLQIHLIETPGHSMGSICIVLNKKYIFTGDSLVQGAKIITRLPGGSKRLYKEITKPFLESLDKDMRVFPGHGEIRTLYDLEIN